jgi:hypothetical protein
LKLFSAFIILAFAFSAGAEDLGTAFFAGGGLGLGQTSLMPVGSSHSNFDNSAYFLEGGFTTGTNFGLTVTGETGQSTVRNRTQTPDYMEIGDASFYALKTAVNYGPIALGGGYRHDQVSVRSLSLAPATYLESKYSGWTPMGFANVSFNVRRRYIGTIEAQYVSGQLKSADSTLPVVKINDISISLRYFIVFD